MTNILKSEAGCIMVIFGGTGDLTYRKLIPALYNLFHEQSLSESFAIVGVGRKTLSNAEYQHQLLEAIRKYSRFPISTDIWEQFSKKLSYYSLNFLDEAGYLDLNSYLTKLDQAFSTQGNRLYYLAVSPEYFKNIPLNLKKNSMINNQLKQHLVIEKPFGKDLTTAKYLNEILTDTFHQDNIYRIDHYLGKEMFQNMLVIRFGNAMFEGIWNSKYIDNIQITAGEVIGVKTRGGYYDSAGALRDMIQSHLLQFLALVAMEPPIKIDAASIRDEKIKLLRSLNEIELLEGNVVRGQYGSKLNNDLLIPSYREEAGIPNVSITETYVALRLFANNFRWGKMPFYLRTGKRMAAKTTYIVIEFKSFPDILYFEDKHLKPNLLEIRIEPEEGVSFQFNTKRPGTTQIIENVKMDFCQNCNFESNSPEAYERLLADILRNDQTLFTSWEEIEASWSFVDRIADLWKQNPPDFPNYLPGTWGPVAADALLERNGHHWWNP